MLALSGPAFAQVGDLQAPGIKHRLEASFALDNTASPAGEHRSQARADLTMRVHVSDHAIDSDYMGVVTVDLKSVDAEQDGKAKTIWEDVACHRDRGLPKFFIMDIRGSIAADGKKLEVMAVPRRVGKHVPDDEVVVQRLLPDSARPRTPGEELGVIVRAQTKRSQIRINLGLTATRCSLPL